MKLFVIPLAAILLTACATSQAPMSGAESDGMPTAAASTAGHPDLYAVAYTPYVDAIRAGDLNAAYNMLSVNAKRLLGDAPQRNGMPFALVRMLVRENSTYQAFLDNGDVHTGCLTINGFTLNNEPGTSSYGYVFEDGSWKIDHVYFFPTFNYPDYEAYNGKTFPDKAICPQKPASRKYTEWN
jgi:hypothetical protein